MTPQLRSKPYHSHYQTHGAQANRGSITCPNCKNPISVTFQALLSDGKLTCGNRACKLVLRVNQTQSNQALSAIAKFKKALEDNLGHPVK